jgi:prefoldin beta subunit
MRDENMEKELQGKINQLSMMEQNLQNFALQKQQFQAQLMELESAEKELQGSKESFKIIGNIMVAKPHDELVKDLGEKKEIILKRIESFERQEAKIKEKADALQKEVLEEMNKKESA